MPVSRVRLPRGVRGSYRVFLNGVLQHEGKDYAVRDGVLEFPLELSKEGRLGGWRWFLGAFGIGYYGQNDQVDVAWEIEGNPRVAHALDIEAPGEG